MRPELTRPRLRRPRLQKPMLLPAGATPEMTVPDTDISGLKLLDGLTYTRPGPATITDYHGRVLDVTDDQVTFNGAWVQKNYIPNMNVGAWSKDASGTGVDPVVVSSGSESRIQFDKGAGAGFSRVRLAATGIKASDTTVLTFEIKTYDGSTKQIAIRLFATHKTVTIDGTYKTFSVSVDPATVDNPDAQILLWDVAATSQTADILVRSPQVNNVTSLPPALQGPGYPIDSATSYNAGVPGVKYFDRTPNYSVDPATGIVTEGGNPSPWAGMQLGQGNDPDGNPLPELLLRSDPAATELCTYSEAISNHTFHSTITITDSDMLATTGRPLSKVYIDGTVSGNNISVYFGSLVANDVIRSRFVVRAGGTGVDDDKIEFGLFNDAFEAHTAEIVTGPGSLSGTGPFHLSGLSQTTDTVVEVKHTYATVGASIRLIIYPGGRTTNPATNYIGQINIRKNQVFDSYIYTNGSTVNRAAPTDIRWPSIQPNDSEGMMRAEVVPGYGSTDKPTGSGNGRIITTSTANRHLYDHDTEARFTAYDATNVSYILNVTHNPNDLLTDLLTWDPVNGMDMSMSKNGGAYVDATHEAFDGSWDPDGNGVRFAYSNAYPISLKRLSFWKKDLGMAKLKALA